MKASILVGIPVSILVPSFLAAILVSAGPAGSGGGGDEAWGVTPDDFITGGGFITGTPSGARGNFGVKGGADDGEFFGHLNYIDHSDGMHVKATSITGYMAINSVTRQIMGTAEIDGMGGFMFTVVVADNGEPGRDDTFSISLSTGYNANGVLEGGNIQLHD